MEFEILLQLILITIIPGLELRASIPYAVNILGLEPFSSIGFIILINILLGLITYLIVQLLLDWFLEKSKFLRKLYNFYIKGLQKRAEGIVEKYGVLGIAFFIAIPLPGSGVYSGAVLAHIFGLRKRDFAIACVIGVLIAGFLVSILSFAFL